LNLSLKIFHSRKSRKADSSLEKQNCKP